MSSHLKASWSHPHSLDWGDSYLFFTGFPLDQTIKYFTLSYQRDFAFVTKTEEVKRARFFSSFHYIGGRGRLDIYWFNMEKQECRVVVLVSGGHDAVLHPVSLVLLWQLWWGQEGVGKVMRVNPSLGWQAFSSLQAMKGYTSYSMNYTLLTIFYDAKKQLQEVTPGGVAQTGG